MPIDPPKLGDALQAEDGGESMLSSSGDQGLKLRLAPERRQLVDHDPDPAAMVGVEQSADDEVEPKVRKRQCRRTGLVTQREEKPAFQMPGPFERAPRGAAVRRRQV